MVQIQARKHVFSVDHADHTAPTRNQELHHTDRGKHKSAVKYLDHEPWESMTC